MNIRMAGIDHSQAEIRIRELFSMTKSASTEAMKRLIGKYDIDGCVILSTCNRTELWLCGGSCSPQELLFELKNLRPDEYREYLTARSGGAAVDYLFELACGLRSQVFGEDQIVTQVNAALSLAREADAAGAVLETLFRYAVTAAKRVKTAVRLTEANASVATGLAEFLRKRFGTLGGLRCIVIGNGEMGRLTASELVKAGCEVRMTVRRYHHGEAAIPDGCGRIPYDERVGQLAWARVVVSATTSPHYTLRRDAILSLEQPMLFCDLAVPRDIDPELADIPGAEVCNTDQICAGQQTGADSEGLRVAREILEEQTEEFKSWYSFRTFAPITGEISALAARDLKGRLEKPLRRLELDEREQAALAGSIGAAAEKTVGRLLFGLRDQLSPLLWHECFDALQRAARGGDKTADAMYAHHEARDATCGEMSGATEKRSATESPVATPVTREARDGIGNETAATAEPSGATNAPVHPYFPMFADLSQKRVVLFGGGSVAARRAASITGFCGSLTVIAPEIRTEFSELGAALHFRGYRSGDCAGFDLALAATDDREINHAIYNECAELGIPVNVADAPHECGFYFPAIAVKDNVVIGITASGSDHRLAKAAARSVRERLDTLVLERGDQANGA